MKCFVALATILIASFSSYSQINPESVLLHDIQLDTTLNTDYYLIKIDLAENLTFKGNFLKRKIEIEPLDSLIRSLEDELKLLGFHQNLRKSIISKISTDGSEFFNKTLLQIIIEFEVFSADSVEFLFKNLNKKNIVSIIAEPKVNDAKVNAAADEIIKRGMDYGLIFAQIIADFNNQVIAKPSNNRLVVFGPADLPINIGRYGYYRSFGIDLRKEVKYKFIYTFPFNFVD